MHLDDEPVSEMYFWQPKIHNSIVKETYQLLEGRWGCLVPYYDLFVSGGWEGCMGSEALVHVCVDRYLELECQLNCSTKS